MSAQTTARTAGKLRVGYLDKNGQRVIESEHIEICTCWHHSVGAIEKQMEANAAFIVQAWNAHDDLVKALRLIKSQAEAEGPECRLIREYAVTALAKAGSP